MRQRRLHSAPPPDSQRAYGAAGGNIARRLGNIPMQMHAPDRLQDISSEKTVWCELALLLQAGN
jgi:hypothetical protein